MAQRRPSKSVSVQRRLSWCVWYREDQTNVCAGTEKTKLSVCWYREDQVSMCGGTEKAKLVGVCVGTEKAKLVRETKQQHGRH